MDQFVGVVGMTQLNGVIVGYAKVLSATEFELYSIMTPTQGHAYKPNWRGDFSLIYWWSILSYNW